MVKYVIRRLIQSVPIFFGITLLAYALMVFTPGGPVSVLALQQGLNAQQVEKLKQQLGVNDPFPIQYLRWLVGDDWMRWDSDGDGVSDGSILIALNDNQGEPLPPGQRRGILRGDFGISFTRPRPVMDIILERIPATLELTVSALIVGLTVGLVIGVLAAVYQGSWFDHLTRVASVIFDAVPVFFLGLTLLLVFGAWLRILPLGDRCPTTLAGSCAPVFERLEYLILPTFVLATGGISAYSRYMRASMLDVVSMDFIRTARAKGLTDRVVWFKHGARNALIPIATFVGPAIAGLWGGAVITETIFNWPGVGREIVRSLGGRDYPVVMAATVLAGVTTILGYLLSDILYGLIDPRIRFD
jgi:peptide/nickel transport system permease protein